MAEKRLNSITIKTLITYILFFSLDILLLVSEFVSLLANFHLFISAFGGTPPADRLFFLR
jgi:hypothetical protein